MLKLGTFSVLVLLTAVPAQLQEANQDCANNCRLAFRCSPYFDSPVWTIVNDVCKIYRNSCLFASVNCARRNQCLEPMQETTQAACQPHCSTCAETSKAPVCAGFPNEQGTFEYITFGNQCWADRYACLYARAYVSTSEGVCSNGLRLLNK